MIAVDTNMLLRYPLNDDAARADTAASLIKNGLRLNTGSIEKRPKRPD